MDLEVETKVDLEEVTALVTEEVIEVVIDSHFRNSQDQRVRVSKVRLLIFNEL